MVFNSPASPPRLRSAGLQQQSREQKTAGLKLTSANSERSRVPTDGQSNSFKTALENGLEVLSALSGEAGRHR